MRKSSEKKLAREILNGLRAEMIDVTCADCGREHPAEWDPDVGVVSAVEWVAVSYVRCPCSSQVVSFVGRGKIVEDAVAFHSRYPTTEVPGHLGSTGTISAVAYQETKARLLAN